MADPDEFVLTGRVVDAETDEGLGSVQLRLFSDTLYESEGTSGSGGGFVLPLSTDTPRARLELRKKGYRPKIIDVFFDTPQRNVRVRLEPR